MMSIPKDSSGSPLAATARALRSPHAGQPEPPDSVFAANHPRLLL